jgi:hypothetical protein
LTLTNPNACGITTQTTATVTFTDADGVVYSASDAEALSATSVTFITPQFQRLGRTRFKVTAGSATYEGSVIVVETLAKPLTLEYTSEGDNEPVTVRWDTSDFDSDEIVTLYIHDLGQGLEETRWTQAEGVVIADNIRASQGSHTFPASTVFGKTYYSGCFYIKRKSSKRCRACKQKRHYGYIRRFQERFWRDTNFNCDRWNRESKDPEDDTPRCPSTEDKARFDSRFAYIDYNIGYYHRGSVNCYWPISPGRSKGGQVCCYLRNGNCNCGSNTGGGYYFYRSPKERYWSHYKHDIMGWFACCYGKPRSSDDDGGSSSKWDLFNRNTVGTQQTIWSWLGQVIYGMGGTTPAAATSARTTFRDDQKCSVFYRRRVKWCGQDYRPPRRRNRGKGDPHLTTFDSFSYTFNGHGDYWLVRNNNGGACHVQARLEPIGTGGGTVITAIAMKCGSDAPVIVKLNGGRTGAEVYVGSEMRIDLRPDGVPTISSGAVVATTIRNGSLNGSLVYVLSGGVDELVMEVSVVAGGQLTFVGSADGPNYEGKILGLAGNANGDSNDDLRPSNDTLNPLPTGSSLREIHYKFGETWRVQNNTADFFFPYGVTVPGTSYQWPPYEQANVPSYEPSFLPGNANGCNPACNGNLDCCFDVRETGDVALATATAQFDNLYATSQNALQRVVKVCEMILFQVLSFAINGLNEIPSFVDGSTYPVSCPPNQTLIGPSQVSCTDGKWSFTDISQIPVCINPNKYQQGLNFLRRVFGAAGNRLRSPRLL